jgi:hypothetical protein
VTVRRDKLCRDANQFDTVLQRLERTQHLSVHVDKSEAGRSKLQKLLCRLPDVALRTLHITGHLDTEPHLLLHTKLNHTTQATALRSRLTSLELPRRRLEGRTSLPRHTEPAGPMKARFDCDAMIRFWSTKQQAKGMSVQIRVQGEYSEWRRSKIGTPHQTIQSMIKRVRIELRRLESLLLGGQDSGPNESRTYDNPFECFGLHSPQDLPLTLSELSIQDFKLSLISPTMSTSFMVSSLGKLSIKQRFDLTSLFGHLINSNEKIQLRVLEIRSYTYDTQMKPKHPYNLSLSLQSS